MKYFSLLLLLLLPACSFAGNAVIRGHITNTLADTISLSYYDNPISFSQQTVTARPDITGNFELSIHLQEEFTECTLRLGNDQADLILSPGDTLAFTADRKSFLNTIHYTGSKEDQANFVAAHQRTLGKLSSTGIKLRTLRN